LNSCSAPWFPALVERQRAIQKGFDFRQTGQQCGIVFRSGNREAQRRGRPIQEGHVARGVLHADRRDRCLRIGDEGRFQARIQPVEGSEAIPGAAQVQPSRPGTQRKRPIEVVFPQELGLEVDVGVRIEDEPAACGQEQPAMVRRLRQKAFRQLQPEWQRLAHQVDIVVRLVDRVARRQRVTDHVDGISPERAAGARGEHQGEDDSAR
jgi:hypothetical protein